MAEISKTLSARTEFISHLEEDITKNDQILEETRKEVLKLQEQIDNIKTLGTYPEHSAMIPIAKNIYMKGRIVHTGEYYERKTVNSESYLILQSFDHTLKSLENRIKLKNDEIEKAEYAKYQLEERIRLLKGNSELISESEDLPEQIKSDKGVALRVGEFYEILEFED